MKPFQLFRTGTHTAASGSTLTFSEDQLKAAVAAYDPALHEAPIVVGHPKDNAPAFGWIKSLDFADGVVTANPDQINADFAELVKGGSYKKRSASWYLPDAPNNPRPGTLYLRHVAFLGAQPPAIKGLKDVSFSDAEEGVIEFSAEDRWAWNSLANAMRGLREWLIGDKGTEVADKVLPNYLISDLETAAKAQVETVQAVPAFSEEDPMKIEELQAQLAARDAEIAALKANQKPADFAERETGITAREAALAAAEQKIARAGIESRVDAAVKAGRLLPAQAKQVADFAASLADKEAVIDFGEGDKAKKVTQREAYLMQIETAPKVVEYGEMSAAAAAPGATAGDPAAVAQKARVAVDKAAAEGRTMSFSEAVAIEMAASEQQ
jgi:hypothetical protein